MVLDNMMQQGIGQTFSFNIGMFSCIAVRDSAYEEKPTNLFPRISVEQWNKLSEENNLHSEENFEMSALLVHAGNHLALIDTGWGTGWAPESGRLEAGRLIDRLKALGLRLSDIDTVIFSHGHPDHIGGTTNAEGEPFFSNARHVMCRDEWNFWASGPELPSLPAEIRETMLSFVHKNMNEMRDCYDIVDNDAEIIPGIRCINAPGHTPGHTAHLISSGDEQLLCIADAAHHPMQLLRPDFHMVMDTVAPQAVPTRSRLFKYAAENTTKVFATHFPFPCLGRIAKTKSAWFWHPQKA